MDLVILHEKLLVNVLIQVIADSSVLNLHAFSEFFQTSADVSKVVIKFRLDDELMVIQCLQIDGSLHHFLELC